MKKICCNCATGFTSNFVTDNSSPPFGGCSPSVTPPGKNLIDISGEPNWQDCSGATVGGLEGHGELACAGNQEVGGLVLVSVGVTADDDGLGPGGDEPEKIFLDRRSGLVSGANTVDAA